MVTRRSNLTEVLMWGALMAAFGAAMFFTVMNIRATRAEDAPAPRWVIVATVTAANDTDKHFQAYYNKEPGKPVFFETEADCKKVLNDKKGDFLANVWPKFQKVVKQHDATVSAPRCDILLPVPKGDSV